MGAPRRSGSAQTAARPRVVRARRLRVEIAASVEDAIECLAVMTPALIVIDENLAGQLPGPSDLLNRPRPVRIEPTSDRDAVGQELARDGQRDRGELFRQP